MTPSPRLPEPDRPWMMRTYSGHSTPRPRTRCTARTWPRGRPAYRRLRSADPDRLRLRRSELARGEVGKVGVPDRAHRRHGGALRRHPARRDEHVDDDQRDGRLAARAVRRRRRASTASTRRELRGTTQNDIIKEFLSRGTYIFPPEPSLRLIADVIEYTVEHVPAWNPMNICSYHLQEAGATPVQEIAFTLANAIARARPVRERVGDDGDCPASSGASRSSSTPACGSSRSTQAAARSRACGTARPRALRRHRRAPAPLPLRRAGQLARPHRVAAGEQRPAHRARGARGDARSKTRARARSSCRRGTRRSACRGRGTSSGRCASSRCSRSRPTCSSTRDIFEGSKVIEAKVAELVDGARGRARDRRRARRRGRARSTT